MTSSSEKVGALEASPNTKSTLPTVSETVQSALWMFSMVLSKFFLFIWFYLFLKLLIFSPLTPSHFTNFCTIESWLDSEVLRDLKIKKKKSLKGTDPKNYVLTLLDFMIRVIQLF